MADTDSRIPLLTSSPTERVFPALKPDQIERAAPHGRLRRVQKGEVLVELGTPNTRIFIVRTGRLEILRPMEADEQLVASLGPGQFTGETSVLAGRRGMARIRVYESGEVIEVERDQLLALVQTDSELSDMFMRAFILRRLELIERGFGDVVLLGSAHSPGTLRIKEFLTRNNHPYSYRDLDRDPGVQALLDRFHITVDDIPVAMPRGCGAS
jgi:thioredoxin reductase (NADPH)